MNPSTLPLIILAGSDGKPAVLRGDGEGLHPLTGAKGHDLRVGGRPLIEVVIQQYRRAGGFAPIYVAGPAAVYGEVAGADEVVDTDSTFGANLKAAVEHAMARHPGNPVAISACDILPEARELAGLLADYREHAPLDFWFAVVRVPEDPSRLGASAWKPRYRLLTAEGTQVTLPGHLAIVEPRTVRRALLFRTLQLTYASRNRSVSYRFWLIVRHVVAGLLWEDLRRLLRLRPPTFTAGVLTHGLLLASHLRRGVISPEELAHRLRSIFIRSSHRRHHPRRRGRIHITDALSLAKDIDTEEEARELLSRAAP